MEEKIRAIIDEWDPIGLFPFAPKDEYANESQLIYLACQKTKSIPDLAQAIHEIFSKSFGDDVFTSSMDECLEVAGAITHNM